MAFASSLTLSDRMIARDLYLLLSDVLLLALAGCCVAFQIAMSHPYPKIHDARWAQRSSRYSVKNPTVWLDRATQFQRWNS
jgi:hypothetical protein